MEQLKIKIQGMSCGGCVRSVERVLSQVPGVRVDSVEVGSALVSYDPARADRAALERAIQAAGFVPGR